MGEKEDNEAEDEGKKEKKEKIQYIPVLGMRVIDGAVQQAMPKLEIKADMIGSRARREKRDAMATEPGTDSKDATAEEQGKELKDGKAPASVEKDDPAKVAPTK